MKLIKSIILSLFPIFGMSQSSLTLSICECSTSEVNEIIQIAIFYGYKFEDHLIKEVGVSDYISATRRSEPSPLTIIVKLVIVNNQSGVNKKIILTSRLERFESNFDIYNREYYSRDSFLNLISYN